MKGAGTLICPQQQKQSSDEQPPSPEWSWGAWFVPADMDNSPSLSPDEASDVTCSAMSGGNPSNSGPHVPASTSSENVSTRKNSATTRQRRVDAAHQVLDRRSVFNGRETTMVAGRSVDRESCCIPLYPTFQLSIHRSRQRRTTTQLVATDKTEKGKIDPEACVQLDRGVVTNGFKSILPIDRNHHTCGDPVGAPPTEGRIDKQTHEQDSRRLGA